MRSDAWKRTVARPLVLCIVLVFAAPSSVLPNADTPPAVNSQIEHQKAKYAPGQLIVKLSGSLSGELLERHGLIIQERFESEAEFRIQSPPKFTGDLFLLHGDEGSDMEALAAAVAAEPGVAYAEPNWRYELSAIPNDPLFSAPNWIDGQWYLERSGFKAVWDRKTQTRTVVVVLDTGGNPTHEDLAANTWQNTREANGAPGVDDDGNGFSDDRYGWNFMDNNPNITDTDGHGTNMAGLGAVGNNGKGGSGASWSVKVMNLKVGRGTDIFTSEVVRAIPYAKAALDRQGEKGVFNASFGGTSRSQALHNAIRDSGMLFVASSGNHGNSDPTGIYYPAGFNQELANVISVTASSYDEDDRIVSGASVAGSDLAAPGAWILTTQPGGGYTHGGGTSFSAPLVAHAAAMLMDEVGDPLLTKARILKSVDVRQTLSGKTRTGGRLNVARALNGQFNANSAPTVSLPTLAYKGMEGTPLPITAVASDPDGDFLNVTWRFSDGQSASGNLIALVFPLGNYWGTVTVSDGVAETMLTFTIQITDRVEVRPKVKGIKKLTLTVTSSRQNRNPRPKVMIRELNQEIPYDEEYQAYRIVLNIKKNTIPSPLTIESEVGGTFTLSWR